MLSCIGETFVEILKNEWLGIVASAFVLVSFLFSKQTVTRLINICGCIVFVVYGILLPAYSTAFMNGALIIVHIVFLVKDYLAKKKGKGAPEITDIAEDFSANAQVESLGVTDVGISSDNGADGNKIDNGN